MTEIYLVASGTNPSRQMTMPEIMAALTAGELSIEDHFWQEGRPRWEPLGTIPGLRARVAQAGPARPPAATAPRAPARAPVARNPLPSLPGPWAAGTPPDGRTRSLDFWAPPGKPQLRLWSSVSYTLVSLLFTPLLGSVFMLGNHKNAGERNWRVIPVFWIIVWAAFIIATVCERIIYKGAHWLPCVAGFGGLWVFWFFTCALPHRNFLKTQPADINWRSDWGKPAGFGFLGLVIYTIIMLLVK